MDDLFGDVAPAASPSNGLTSTTSSSLTTTAANDTEFESVLYVTRECYVYKLPPRQSTAGYKASEWGDMEVYLWKGRCRVIEYAKVNSSRVVIRLEDSNTGDLFAQCPFDLSGKSLEPVLDSSRYFVLKVVDINTAKSAYLGLGFRERSEAFDFQVALQDWQKQQRMPKSDPAGSEWSTSVANSPHIPAGPKRDFSLKAGETISVKFGGPGGTTTAMKKVAASGMGSPIGKIPLLAPPPGSAVRR